MNASVNTKLLALLLALNNLEEPLSPSKQAALKKAGQQLAMRPKNWESITNDLMEAISPTGMASLTALNTSLTQFYQAAQTQLDALNQPIPPELIPTLAELKQVLPPSSEVVTRAYFEGKPDVKSDEILNTAINILTTSDPADTTKKLSSLEKLQEFLKERFNK